jgi:hypothetical protein
MMSAGKTVAFAVWEDIFLQAFLFCLSLLRFYLSVWSVCVLVCVCVSEWERDEKDER